MTGTTRTTSTALSGGLLLLALGAPLLLAGPAHALGPVPVPSPVAEAVKPVVKPVVQAVAPVVEAAAPVTEPVVQAAAEAAPVAKPVADAVVERAPEPARPVVEPVAEAVTKAAPSARPTPGPSSTPRPQVVPPVVGAPGTSTGNAPVRPAAGTTPSPVARPAADGSTPLADDAALAGTAPGGAGVAAVDPARIGGGLSVASDIGRGIAEAPITAGMPAFSDVPDGTPTVVAAPLAAPPAGLLPTGPARPTDLPAALVVFAAIAVAAVGTGQLTEVVSRRQAAAAR